MNEWYLRDLSRRQKTAIRIKGESGKPTTNCAIYGYKKMPGYKYSWYIDEEAAAVVRRILRLTIEGNGPYNIARILYDDKVETTAVYATKHGRGVWKSKEKFLNHAIVDKEMCELTQKLRKTPRRYDTLGEANPLTGLLFCADCGAKMTNHRSRGGTENNPYPLPLHGKM